MTKATPSGKSDEWVVVAEYQVDAYADMTINLLEGSQIPAVRLPISAVSYASVGYMDPVRVLVPPDRAEEARELIEAEEPESEPGRLDA